MKGQGQMCMLHIYISYIGMGTNVDIIQSFGTQTCDNMLLNNSYKSI